MQEDVMSMPERSTADTDWAAIAVIIFGMTAFSVSQGLTYPLIALVLAERGVPTSIIGFNGASYAVGAVVSTLLIGRITAVVNGHRLIVAALIGVSVSLALFA